MSDAAHLEELDRTIGSLRAQLRAAENERDDLKRHLAREALFDGVQTGDIVAALQHWEERHGRRGVDLRRPMRDWLHTVDPHLNWSHRSRTGPNYEITYIVRHGATPREVATTAAALIRMGRKLRKEQANEGIRTLAVDFIHQSELATLSGEKRVSFRLQLTAQGWNLLTGRSTDRIAGGGANCLPLFEQACAMTLSAEQ